MTDCPCPWCAVFEYIENNGDMCLNFRTSYTTSYAIGFEIDPNLTDRVKNGLSVIIKKLLTTYKTQVKNIMGLNSSINFDMTDNSKTMAYNVNLQLLMKSKRVPGSNNVEHRYWKLCIHKKFDGPHPREIGPHSK